MKKDMLIGQCIAEFIGTGLLIFFGVGCVAALVFKAAKVCRLRIWYLMLLEERKCKYSL